MSKIRIIIISSIILICILALGIGIYVQMTENDYKKAMNKSEEDSVADEKVQIINDFDNIFQNDIKGSYENIKKEKEDKEIVYMSAQKTEIVPNKYDLDVQIPQININSKDVKNINTEIKKIFQNKAANILSNVNNYTIYHVKYHAYINENILSLIIKANLKEGNNPEREIIKTYNVNLETNNLMNFEDIINYKNLNKNDIQNTIKQEIESKLSYEKSLTQLGYNTYARNIEDDMYKIENTNNFILGEQGKLYIIYAYGNKNYTSETDLIVIE